MAIPQGLQVYPFPTSSYVWQAAYDAAAMMMYVTYKDKRGRATVTAAYDNVSPGLWAAFLAAPSQGSWCVRNLHPRSYTLV